MAGVFGNKEDDREPIFALKRQCLMGLPAVEAYQTITPIDVQVEGVVSVQLLQLDFRLCEVLVAWPVAQCSPCSRTEGTDYRWSSVIAVSVPSACIATIYCY